MSARFGPTGLLRGPGRVRLSAATALLAVVAMAAGCSGDDDDDKPAAGASGTPISKGEGPAASVKLPDGCTTVLDAETPAQLSVAVSQALFTSSPVVVVAAGDASALQPAIEAATAAGAPLLVTEEAADAPSGDATVAPTAAAGTSSGSGPLTFDADTADCAAPPPEVTPSAAPSSTASPSATADSDDEESEDNDSGDTDSGDTDSEPTATASPSLTPAAFSVAMAEGDACLDESGAPAAEPTASASSSATPTATTSASATPSSTSTSTASPEATPSTAPAPANAVLDPTVAAEIKRLNPKAVLAASPDVAGMLRAALPDVKVVENASELPETSTPDGLSGLSVLLPAEEDLRAGALAARTTATVAGADAVGVGNGDPRAGECAVQALFEAKPTKVLGVGDFGSAERLAYRMSVVGTGVELPGGGQVFFPGRRLVAMYGYPGAPELGVLGAQGIEVSIDRVQNIADLYDGVSDQPIIPTFEIITTVAQGVPGRDGDYSAESDLDKIRPWIEQADKAGVYVILDLQPGRTDFLTQAKRYAELLKHPHVGLALDPEWRLKPGQVHLRQIGSVDSSEINRVIDWLADLTAEYRLPQKLLVLHQFSLTMITNRSGIDTSRDELALLIHMDGQGEPSQKDGTWRIVTNTVPDEIWMGWKNFYKKDTRLMSARETLDREPVPVMISYQ